MPYSSHASSTADMMAVLSEFAMTTLAYTRLAAPIFAIIAVLELVVPFSNGRSQWRCPGLVQCPCRSGRAG